MVRRYKTRKAVTADVRLCIYCEKMHTTPKEFTGIGSKDIRQMKNLLLDYVSMLEENGRAPPYMSDILKALRSWLSFNYVTLVRKIKIKNSTIPVTLENEVVPSREKLADILNSARARERTSISLMALSGVRPEVLGNYQGKDGLKLADIKDLAISNNDIHFERIPARIVVRSTLSKAGHQYFTFLPEIGCKYLQGYIRERIAGGMPIRPDSPVITFVKGYRIRTNGTTGHLRTSTITKEIKGVFGIIIKERPYVLRSYFDTNLLMAESKSKMTHAYRQFFMGHKGDIEARYTTNKQRIPDSLIDDMRAAYMASQDFLSPFRQEGTMDATKPAIQQTIQGEAYESILVDSEEDLLSCVRNGWEVLKEMSSGKVLLRRSNHIHYPDR